MMGLSDAALLGSWYTLYAIVFFIVSVRESRGGQAGRALHRVRP